MVFSNYNIEQSRNGAFPNRIQLNLSGVDAWDSLEINISSVNDNSFAEIIEVFNNGGGNLPTVTPNPIDNLSVDNIQPYNNDIIIFDFNLPASTEFLISGEILAGVNRLADIKDREISTDINGIIVGGSSTGNSGLSVSLSEPNREATEDQLLWTYIRNGTVDFNDYRTCMDSVMNGDVQANRPIGRAMFMRSDAFDILKLATKRFLETLNTPNVTVNSTAEERQRTRRRSVQNTLQPSDFSRSGANVLDYIETIINNQNFQNQANQSPLIFNEETPNLIELLWSYWHEEGGLVQTMNAISLRFQNVRGAYGSNDPLANLNIDPIRPLNNLMWGYIEDERNRLSMARRNLEYQYEYGLSLVGSAVPNVSVAESRSQFIPAFHNLLKAANDFYQQANYTTVIPDGFPILNHLREVHLLLAEGAHNSFGDLPETARAEMLMQQWILARPEMREFLGGRIMVPYVEPWMDRVDSMKNLQGWTPVNISHFHTLGDFGEKLLLSIRYGNWNSNSVGALNAANWAHYWRTEVQRYIHAYKACTGVDLASDISDARLPMQDNPERYVQPSVLVHRRGQALPQGQSAAMNTLSRKRIFNG